MGLGSFIGILVSFAAYYWLEKRLLEVIQVERRKTRASLIIIPIIASIVVCYIHAIALPQKAYLSWYPALAVYLMGIGWLGDEREYTLPHKIVGLFLLATTPLVDYTNGYVGGGLVGLAYFAAGIYALAKGLK
jgi:uncharacterized membrane protein YfbV (UPF0208 family)